MISTIIFSILFIIISSLIVFFIFNIFVPALKEQDIVKKSLLFADNELKICEEIYKTQEPAKADNPSEINIQF